MKLSPSNVPVSSAGAGAAGAWMPGLTVRSVLASLLAMLIVALAIQMSTVDAGMEPAGDYGLPIPGVVVLVGFVVLVAVAAKFLKWQLLTRAEMMAVFYCMVLAAPLMTQGFWHRVLGITATIPRGADFKKMAFFSDRLWPHGPNVLKGAFNGPVVLEGTANSDVVEKSPVDSSVWSFWIDPAGRGSIGKLTEPVPAMMAVSGFSGLLRDGMLLPNKEGPLHPRTAIGLDSEGRYVTLVVVDGRRKGDSEGVNEYELAELMLELGCSDALNLDGGGSSIMLARGRLLNRPSEFLGVRPVPVMLGIVTAKE